MKSDMHDYHLASSVWEGHDGQRPHGSFDVKWPPGSFWISVRRLHAKEAQRRARGWW